MAIVYAVALAGLVGWMARLWRRSPPPPSWAALVALVLVGLGAWCIFEMAASLLAEYRVPETLPTPVQVQQAAMHSARMMRWGMRFWAAGLVTTGWLVYVSLRWEPANGGIG
jgi:hypothetical protein